MPREWLRTGQCARVIGVSSRFIRDECEEVGPDGKPRLGHIRIERPNGRDIIRVAVDEFRAYLTKHCARALPDLDRFLAGEFHVKQGAEGTRESSH